MIFTMPSLPVASKTTTSSESPAFRVCNRGTGPDVVEQTDALDGGFVQRVRAFRYAGRQTTARPRPGAAARARMLASPEGQALLQRGRQELSALLVADGLVPLAALRLSKGLSQTDLAATSGIRQPQLSRLESGLHEDIMVATLERLANALGVSLDEVNRAMQASRAARLAVRAP